MQNSQMSAQVHCQPLLDAYSHANARANWVSCCTTRILPSLFAVGNITANSLLNHRLADDSIRADKLRKQASSIDDDEDIDDQNNSVFQDELEGAATNSAATSDASESGRLQGQKYIQHHRSFILGTDITKVPPNPSLVKGAQ
jgi:hypothetical protein